MAFDYRWCWSVDGAATFEAIAPERWARCGANPRRLLCEAEPAMFAPVDGGWGRKGWTNLILAKADVATVKSALWMAWRNTAPKKLLKAHAE